MEYLETFVEGGVYLVNCTFRVQACMYNNGWFQARECQYKATSVMCKLLEKCLHKETGKEGVVRNLMENQYGIYWTFTYDSKTPNHFYWNDMDKITIL